MRQKFYYLNLIILTLFLIEITQAREYCVQSSWIDIWCDDGYGCCSGSGGYWCCRKVTHSCGDTAMSCKLSVAMILIIIAIICGIIGAVVGCVMYQRRKQSRLRIMQQQQVGQIPKPTQGQFVMQPMQQLPVYGQQPQYQQPVQGMPVYEVPLQHDQQPKY